MSPTRFKGSGVSRTFANSVLSGGKSLDEASKTVQERKRATDSDESKLYTLKAEAPDLAQSKRRSREKVMSGPSDQKGGFSPPFC